MFFLVFSNNVTFWRIQNVTYPSVIMWVGQKKGRNDVSFGNMYWNVMNMDDVADSISLGSASLSLGINSEKINMV